MKTKLFLIALLFAAVVLPLGYYYQPLPVQAQNPAAAFRIRYASAAPATCNADRGEVYFNTTDDKIYRCTATNTWTEVGGGSGISGSGTANFLTYFDTSSSVANSLFGQSGNSTTPRLIFGSNSSASVPSIIRSGDAFTFKGANDSTWATLTSQLRAGTSNNSGQYVSLTTTYSSGSHFDLTMRGSDTHTATVLSLQPAGSNNSARYALRLLNADSATNTGRVFIHGDSANSKHIFGSEKIGSGTYWPLYFRAGNNAMASLVDLIKLDEGFYYLDAGTKPTCDSSKRGLVWTDFGGAGVADTHEICLKNSSDTYAWVALATP